MKTSPFFFFFFFLIVCVRCATLKPLHFSFPRHVFSCASYRAWACRAALFPLSLSLCTPLCLAVSLWAGVTAKPCLLRDGRLKSNGGKPKGKKKKKKECLPACTGALCSPWHRTCTRRTTSQSFVRGCARHCRTSDEEGGKKVKRRDGCYYKCVELK